ncbi:Hint domain-containing protein [Aliisedimentitalea scapharcae]|uniref:Hint domain-containing protein n=1 Tax=Aliisedimentitalea scapharcae TaxID=1524259 RepID=A0ABZ2XSL2_9RHOB|nr:Hint domain-containing protein [Rhodobacteraceae bacterium M382]
MATGAELGYQTNANATAMAEAIFGDGATVVSASYSGWSQSSAIYSNGDALAPGATPGDTGVILSTGRASHFTRSGGDPNRSASTSTNTSGQNNNPDFNAAAGTNTYDASYLDVSFIPTGSLMTMQFVFSSEEYPEYTDSLYQDFVGVWVNGTQVELGIGDGDTDPGNVNSSTNENLFLDNTGDAYNTEMDGLTVTMTLTMNVIPGVVNTIRIGIADVTDSSYDSNLLIAANSVQTDLVALGDSTDLFPTGSVDLDVTANDVSASGGTLTITHINGIAVNVGDIVQLNTGQSVQLNSDGTLKVIGDGDTEEFNFTYTVSNGANTDTGIVQVNSIPCFVAGTLIATPYGEVPVEELQPGDPVWTRDDGAQPLRWIGSRVVQATGDYAPIHIRAGTFGEHRDLLVSPQHRILVRDAVAELLFGEDEVLVAAKDMINDQSVVRHQGGEVTYVHIMFDRHQVVYSEGLQTESFLPGPQSSSLFEQPIIDEICTLFPELDPHTGEGYGPAARPTLRSYETQLLFNREQAA